MDGIHEGHRARMKKKLLENGERSLADHELLEVLLYYAIPRRDTNELAHRLLKQAWDSRRRCCWGWCRYSAGVRRREKRSRY